MKMTVGQKNYIKRVGTPKMTKKMTEAQDMTFDKKKKIKENSKADMIQDKKFGINYKK